MSTETSSAVFLVMWPIFNVLLVTYTRARVHAHGRACAHTRERTRRTRTHKRPRARAPTRPRAHTKKHLEMRPSLSILLVYTCARTHALLNTTHTPRTHANTHRHLTIACACSPGYTRQLVGSNLQWAPTLNQEINTDTRWTDGQIDRQTDRQTNSRI